MIRNFLMMMCKTLHRVVDSPNFCHDKSQSQDLSDDKKMDNENFSVFHSQPIGTAFGKKCNFSVKPVTETSGAVGLRHTVPQWDSRSDKAKQGESVSPLGVRKRGEEGFFRWMREDELQ